MGSGLLFGRSVSFYCQVKSVKNKLDIISRFMEQLTRDVTFLRDLGLIDYSLLIGIQPSLQMSNSRPDTTASLAQLVNSLKRSSLSFPSSAAGFVFCFFVFLCLNKYVKFEDQFEIPVAINISRQTFLIVFLWLQK